MNTSWDWKSPPTNAAEMRRLLADLDADLVASALAPYNSVDEARTVESGLRAALHGNRQANKLPGIEESNDTTGVPWSVTDTAFGVVFKGDASIVGWAMDKDGVEAAWIYGEIEDDPRIASTLPWPGVALSAQDALVENEAPLYIMSEDDDHWQRLWAWVARNRPHELSTLAEYGPVPLFDGGSVHPDE